MAAPPLTQTTSPAVRRKLEDPLLCRIAEWQHARVPTQRSPAMPAGYIYVLINPAMQGLAKVGKTTRPTDLRASELSSATGVPSPFILAYQQPVGDCDQAEALVHARLTELGHRHSAQREFFSAPLHVIVEHVHMAARMYPASGEATDGTGNQQPTADPGHETFLLGLAYFEGDGDVVRDPKRALELFDQASRAGSAAAASYAGMMCQYGYGLRKSDYARAIDYYKRSVKLGRWIDLGAIAMAFHEAGQPRSAEPYWAGYFEELARFFGKHPGQVPPNDVWEEYATTYIGLVSGGLVPASVDASLLSALSEPLLCALKNDSDRVEQAGGADRDERARRLARATSYMQQLAKGHSSS